MTAPLDEMRRPDTRSAVRNSTDATQDDAEKIAHRIQPPSSADLDILAQIPETELLTIAKYQEARDRARIAQWMVALFFSGYGILLVILLLTGSQAWGFYLESWVLAVLIVSMSSSVMYTLRRVLISFFPVGG